MRVLASRRPKLRHDVKVCLGLAPMRRRRKVDNVPAWARRAILCIPLFSMFYALFLIIHNTHWYSLSFISFIVDISIILSSLPMVLVILILMHGGKKYKPVIPDFTKG